MEQWEEQDCPWQPDGRRHADGFSPSLQDPGGEVGEEEDGDWD